jgi:predicted HicB family RNase H-like nuclease
MTTETNNAMTINMDDANLPTEGPAWEAMLEHVLANASSEVLYADVDPEWVQSNFDIGDIYDNDEIVDYVQEADIPIGEIYNDEEVVAYAKEVVVGAVMTLQELHDMKIDEYLKGTRDEREANANEVRTLKKEIAEQADIISRQNEEIAELKEMVDVWVKSYLEHLDQIQKEN